MTGGAIVTGAAGSAGRAGDLPALGLVAALGEAADVVRRGNPVLVWRPGSWRARTAGYGGSGRSVPSVVDLNLNAVSNAVGSREVEAGDG